VPTGREKKYKSLLKQLVVAANKENKRKDYKDPPAEDLYGEIEFI
jgi:hypothetical protein